MILEVSCRNFAFILRILGYLLFLMQWVIPIVLIVLIIIDMAKIMINADDKQKKEGVDRAVKRIIYALIIFFVPMLVKLIFKTINNYSIKDVGGGKVSANSWVSCFNDYVINRK